MAYRFTVYPAQCNDPPVVALVDDDEDGATITARGRADDDGLTVAANARAVLRDLWDRGFDMARCCFLYRNPRGHWDELAVDLPGEFLGYLTIADGECPEVEAVEALRDSYRPLGETVAATQAKFLLFPARGRAGGRRTEESDA